MKKTLGILLLMSSVITGCQTGKMGELACYSGTQKILLGKGYIEEQENGTYIISIEGRKRTINAHCVAMYGGHFPWEQYQHGLPEDKE